ISGGGEPLMYPQLIPAVAFMRSKGLKVGIFSNGTLLTQTLAKFLMENLLFFRVALDASTRETYRKIHGKDEFEKLKENLKLLVKLKSNGGATIGAKYLVSTRNWMEIYDAADLARRVGLDYFQFKMLRDSRFTPEGEVLKKAVAGAERARGLTDGDYQVFGSLKKTRPVGRCFLNQLHPVVDATGTMYLCAFFHHRKQSHKIGSIYEKSLPEIWYSERHFKAFKSTKPMECAVFDCPFHEAGALAKEWIVNNKKHLEFI
ncbi:MAG: radical SAM protein, partial [Actinomycetota bacterium]